MPPYDPLSIPEAPLSIMSPTESARGRKTKRSRSVQFSAEEPKVFDVPHLLDLSEEEIADIYYTAEQFALLRDINNVLTKMLANGEKEDLSRFSYRGLLTPDGKRQQRKIKSKHLSAVLSFEKVYDEDDTRAAHRLALTCQSISRKAVKGAIQLAQQDARDVFSESALSFQESLLKKCAASPEFNLDAMLMKGRISADFDDDDDQTVYSVTDVIQKKKSSSTSKGGLRKLSFSMRKNFRMSRGKQ